MAINTGNVKFRKVNVDQYGDSLFQDDQLEESKSSLEINQINGLLTSGKYTEALLSILQNAPINSKDQNLKDTASKLALRAISQTKPQNIDSFLSTLDAYQLDLLLAYVYRGFEQSTESSSCTNLLTWHAKNFHDDCIASINKQINMELYASYVYMAMAYHFKRDDVALPGFHKYFLHQSNEEREHAMKLLDYQTLRGGRIVLQNIVAPQTKWDSGLHAMEDALKLEKEVNQNLIDLHKLAAQHDDNQFTDFLEAEFLKEQVESISEISNHVTNLKRVGTGLGEYIFDKETLKGEK